MSQSQAQLTVKKEKTFRFPVRNSFIVALGSTILFLVAFFLWYGYFAGVCQQQGVALPQWLQAILYPNLWHPVASWIVAILLTAVVVVLLYVLIMIVYLVYKRRHANAKFRCEIIAIGIAILLSVTFKAVILSLDAQGHFQFDFVNILRAFFGAVYAALGGFSFEGLPGGDESVSNIFLICCYYGSSVVAGLVFISAIGSYAAYEFYSFLLLRVLRTKDMDIYIFTALNDETLNLAKTITHDKDHEKARNSLIIFSGSALQPFDRHDIRCTEVMAHGYIYWSVSANDDNTILKKLWPHSKSGMASYYKSITVFAFDSDDDHIPNEEENMDYVLLDIKNRLDHMEETTQKRAARLSKDLDLEPGALPGNRGYLQREDDLAELDAELAELQRIRSAGYGGDTSFVDQKILELQKRQSAIEGQQQAYYEKLKAKRDERLKQANVEDVWGDATTDEQFLKLQKFKHESDLRHGYDLAHIGYYIMTKRRIDYQAYQNKIASLEERFKKLYLAADDECIIRHHELKVAVAELSLAKSALTDAKKALAAAQAQHPEDVEKETKAVAEAGKRVDEAAAKRKVARARDAACWQLAKPFSIHVWNEADSIASEAQSAIYSGDLPETEEPQSPDKGLTWVVSLGFGTNGQSIAKALYSFSSEVDGKGEAAKFFCDVFDPRGFSHIAGLFQMEMPYSACLSFSKDASFDPEKSYQAMFDDRIGTMLDDYKGSDVVALENAIRREMPLPAFCFHDGGFGKVGFSDLFTSGPALWKEKKEQYGADTEGDATFYCPDFIVVATGDDYESIRVVNALAGLLAEKKPRQLVTLFVNVWDDKNNNLVEGFNRKGNDDDDRSKQDFLYAHNVRIVIVGNNNDVYRCDRIIENFDAVNYNRVYELVADGGAKEADEFNEQAHRYYRNPNSVKSVIMPRGASDIARNKADLWESISLAQRSYALAAWRGKDLWKRVSSAASHRFGPAFYQMMKKWDSRENFGIFFANLARVEHQRWMRFHLADGWLYSSKRDDDLRRHPCILPIGFIDQGTLAYDLFNVFLGVALSMDSIDRESGFNAAVNQTKINRLTEIVTEDVCVNYPRAYDDGKEEILVTCFGFGKEGEAVAEAIFVNTYDKVRKGTSLSPNRFHCEIYGDEDYAPYRVRHSFAIVTDRLRKFEAAQVTKQTAENYRSLLTNFSKALQEIGGSKVVKKEMSFPDIKFYSADPGNLESISEFVPKMLDPKTRPHYIVLSLGDDAKTLSLLRRLLYLFKTRIPATSLPKECCTLYVPLKDLAYVGKARELMKDADLPFLRTKVFYPYDDGGAVEEAGLQFFAFTMGNGDIDPKDYPESLLFNATVSVDALCAVTQDFAANGPSAIKKEANAIAKVLIGQAADRCANLDLKPYRPLWEKLPEERKRFFINAAIFVKALQNEAEILKKGGVGDAELLSRLATIAHHRNVRYLICDSWVFRDEEAKEGAAEHYSNRLLPFQALKPIDCRPCILIALFALA